MEDLRIRDLNISIINKIKSMSDYRDETVNYIMRPIIREIIEKMHNDDELSVEDFKKSCIKINNISDELIEKLELMAKKIGVTSSQLLRVKLYEYLNNQSPSVKSLFTS